MGSVKTLNPNAEVMGRSAALFMNINAAKGLYEVMKTNFGPKGTIKMLVGGAGGEKSSNGMDRSGAEAGLRPPQAGRRVSGARARCALRAAPRLRAKPSNNAGGPPRQRPLHTQAAAPTHPRPRRTARRAPRGPVCGPAASRALGHSPARLPLPRPRLAPEPSRHQAHKGRQRPAARDADPEPHGGHDRARGSGAG
jgi:hypothetical protein